MTTTVSEEIHNWVNGDVFTWSANAIQILNPATGQPIGSVDYADEATIDEAVDAAARAFHAWKDTALSRRAQVFYELRNLVLANVDELAELVTAEQGKTLADSRAEVLRAVDSIETAASVPAILKGSYVQQAARDVDTYTVPYPLGVCVGITPFNFPVLIPLVMSAIAIAAGNSFVLKPSEQDPGPSVRIAEMYRRAGLPAGVFTVLHGGVDVAEALIDHRDTVAVSFIGSTSAARLVYTRATLAGKRAQALGGAKNHLVVAEDADLDVVADALSSAAFGAAGQRCMAVTTAVAVGGVGDRLIEKLNIRAKGLVVGPGTQPDVDMGPLISAAARERVLGYVRRAEDDGAKVATDRRDIVVEDYENGYYVGPIVLDHVNPTMEIYREEVFGPVLNVVRVDSLDHAIELLHQSEYGNGAAIYTRNGAVARKFHREAPAGAIGVNVPIPLPVASVGFGGWKRSIFGQSGINNAAWDFYTRPKYVTARWDEPTGIDLSFQPGQ